MSVQRLSKAQEQRLLKRYSQHGDPADLAELVVCFQPLARYLAHRYGRGSNTLEDLEQVANLGLVKALQRFSPERGYAFSTFAVPTIVGELKRWLRGSSWAVHVPRRLQEHSAQIRQTTAELEVRLRRPPTVNEIAAELDESLELVLEAMGAGETMYSVSLDARQREDSASLGDVLGAADPAYERVDDIAALKRALPALSDRQREVLVLRFGEGLLQSQIASRLGISQMQVSRVLASGIARLRVVVRHQSDPRVAA